ncbi:MAG TPA: DUF2569 family protein [Thermoanaerobaculia bacterium]|nr:DUF2569 family protein [Thermoanaerobaculia bacterium]
MQQDLDLAATYARWDTEDLVRAATTAAFEFTPEALTAMRQELERRGYTAGPEQAMAAGAPTVFEQVPTGIGGILLLFIVILGVESIRTLVAWVGALGALHHPVGRLIAVAWTCIGAYGLICCVLLVRKDRRAPRLAALCFIAMVVVGVLNALHNYFVMGILRTPFLLRIGVHSGIWLTYLSISKRVKATYGATAGW